MLKVIDGLAVCTCIRPTIGEGTEDGATCGRCHGHILAVRTPRTKTRRTFAEWQASKAARYAGRKAA